MANEDNAAISAADELLAKIVQSQAGLIAYNAASKPRGEDAAAFIAALRAGLIDMYRSVPKFTY